MSVLLAFLSKKQEIIYLI